MISYDVCKRIFDLILCIFLLLFFSIPMLIIALIILFDSGGPIFYRAFRSGINNSTFIMFKFRTMYNNSDLGSGTTSFNDPRITNVGHYLRKTKLDELPQLFNILINNMSFVGPRPELVKYTKLYSGRYLNILSVKPGVTDISSIRYHDLSKIVGSSNAEDYFEKKILRNKNRYRLFYADHANCKLDIFIILSTLKIFLKKIGVSIGK